jgi:mannose-6-phosphate isomerase-like protein (cupin superfamily)
VPGRRDGVQQELPDRGLHLALTAPAGYVRGVLDFRTYGRAAPPHAHDFVQIVMPSRGVLDMVVDGRGGRVDAHHASVIRAGATHTFEATGANRFIVLDADAPPDLRRVADRVFVELTPDLRALTQWLQNARDALDERFAVTRVRSASGAPSSSATRSRSRSKSLPPTLA